MSGRRAGAFLLAVALIAGAWLIRTQVIDGADSTSKTRRTSTVVCITELADACRAAVAGRDDDVTLVIEEANTTLERLGSTESPPGEVWVTMQPFPAMVDRLRETNRLTTSPMSTEALASSTLTLVVAAARAEALTAECGDPVDWRCLGGIAGQPWSAIGGGGGAETVRPAFAPHPATAIGQLGVAAAVDGFFAGARIDGGNIDFITWARNLSNASSSTQLRGNTAINQIQVRPSLLDIAIGATAELADPDDPRFSMFGPDPMITLDAVAAAGTGSAPSADLLDDLSGALIATGWDEGSNASTDLTPDDMLLIRNVWEDYR